MFYISKEAKVAAELLAFLCIQEVLGSNFDTENTILSKACHDFPQSFDADSKVVP